ncbi:ROK family transcriptional regulator [Halobacillus mangrovi]|uniref:ROK family transcriptional regulator n=1 Tax=Halobacillus mangrovi TaxID=402384 RepID=UPI003D989EE2
MGLKGQNTTRTKQFNRSLVLQTLLRNGSISRHQIAQMTNLTRGTITYITSELLEEGLIQEQGNLPSEKPGAGRRSVGLTLKEDAVWVIGMHIGMKEVSIGLVNLNGKVKEVYKTSPSEEFTVKAYLDFLLKELTEYIKKHNSYEVSGIGIGVIGAVDIHRGIVLGNEQEGWPEIPIVSYLSEHLQLPVFTDNDVSSMTLAEKMFGQSKHNSDFMCLYIGRSLGAGLVLNDELYRSGISGGGEFGHMTYMPEGKECWCGNLGCINEYASLEVLAKQLGFPTTHNLLNQIDLKDKKILEAVEDMGEKISVVLTSFINMVHVEKVVVSGSAAHPDLPFVKQLSKHINERSFLARMQQVEVVGSQIGEDIEIIGAGGLALLNGVFKNAG